MSAITAKASRKMKKYAVLTREPRCFLGSFDFSWEQRKAIDIADYSKGNGYSKGDLTDAGTPIILYGRLYTKYQFAISEVDTFAVPRNGAVYSQGNEVIVPASGETAEDIARASAVEKSGVLLGGDLNILRPFDFMNPLFLALAISNGEPQKELAKKAQGKSVVHIHNSDIQEVTIAYPSRTEQDRIVSVFRQLDHLITLHQRKFEKLTNVKKSMLEKMFPQNGSSYPEIRFKGFTDPWEQRKLGDMMNVTSVKRIHQSDWTDSGVRFLRARDIVAAAKNEEPDDYLYISKEKYEEYSTLSGKVGVSDLLVTGVGTIGVPYLVRNLEPLYFKDGNIIWFQNSDKIDGKFLFYSFSAEQIQGFINESAGIGTVGTYTIESGKKTPISLPNQIEQAKVGEFFQQLDNLITLHQRQPFLQSPPDISLIVQLTPPFYTFSWEQRKLGEMGQTYTGLSGKTKDDFGHGQARFVTYMNVFSNPISNPEMTEPIEIDPKQNEVEVGDVFFTTSSETPEEVGMSSILLEKRGKTYLNSFCFGFRPSEKIDSYYLAYMLRSESTRAKIILLAQGISRYNISKNKVMEIAVSLPSLDEQKMIGQYFSQLDNLITLHQRKPFLMKWRTSDANRNKTNRLVL